MGRQREHHTAKPEADEGADCRATQRCEEALRLKRRPYNVELQAVLDSV